MSYFNLFKRNSISYFIYIYRYAQRHSISYFIYGYICSEFIHSALWRTLMRTKFFLFVHHTTSILAKLSTWCFEHSGDISCSLLVNPSHIDESWEGRSTCMWIYIYILVEGLSVFSLCFYICVQIIFNIWCRIWFIRQFKFFIPCWSWFYIYCIYMTFLYFCMYSIC